MTILDCYLEQWHNTCTYIMWCCVLEGYYAANVSSSRLRRAFQKFGQRLSNLCQNGYTALTVACCYGHAVFWQGRSYILPSCPHYLWVAGKNVRLSSLDVYPRPPDGQCIVLVVQWYLEIFRPFWSQQIYKCPDKWISLDNRKTFTFSPVSMWLGKRRHIYIKNTSKGL